MSITERLMVLIEAKADEYDSALRSAKQSSEQLAVAEDKRAAASARVTAAADKEAVAEAKLGLVTARQAGDDDAIASAETRVAAAMERSTASKAAAAAASARLTRAEAEASAATLGLGESSVKAGGLLDTVKTSLGGVAESLGGISTLGPAAAAVASFKFVEDGVKSFEHLTDQVRTFTAVTGLAAPQASLLVGQMKQLGVDPDTAAKALQRLGSSIGDGTTKLGQFGVAVALNKDGSVDLARTLDNLRTAYQTSADAATRDAIAKQLGLRNATALIPLLQATRSQVDQLNESTRASGGVVSQSEVDRGLQLKIAVNELKDSWEGLERGAGKSFISDLTAMVHEASLLTDSIGKVDNLIHDISGGSKGLLSILNPLELSLGSTEAWDKLHRKKTADTLATQADTQATQDNQGAVDSLGGSVNTVADAEDRLTMSLTGDLNAKKAVADANQALADANQTLADKTDALNKLLAEGPVNAAKVASANDTLVSASNSVASALTSEQRAQEGLTRARQAATALDLADAQNKIALAGDKISSAKAAEESAKEKLDALLGSGSASADEIAAAEADLKTRHDDVTQSVIDQGKAQADLIKVKQKGTEADPAVVAAEDQVQNAHRQVTDAVRRRDAAEVKLREAEAPDPAFAQKVADANKAVADAHKAIADAQDRQVTSALALSKATDVLNASLLSNAQATQGVIAQMLGLLALGQITGPALDRLLGTLGPAGEAATNIIPGAKPGPPAPTGPVPPPPAPLDVNGVVVSPPPGADVNRRSVGLIARATGGPVEPGGDYLVGEHGPEHLRMGARGGWITPASQAQMPELPRVPTGGGVTSVPDAPASPAGSGGPLVAQAFYGYDTAAVARGAAREMALAVHAVLPVALVP